MNLLKDGGPVPIIEVLLLNAHRALVFEDYRLAVVEAETAFEVALDQVITQHYRSKNRTATEIEQILGAGLKNLIKQHIAQATAKNFAATEEYKIWKEKLYDVRNAVIRDGRDVDPDEARRAVKAAENAISWLRKESLS